MMIRAGLGPVMIKEHRRMILSRVCRDVRSSKKHAAFTTSTTTAVTFTSNICHGAQRGLRRMGGHKNLPTMFPKRYLGVYALSAIPHVVYYHYHGHTTTSSCCEGLLTTTERQEIVVRSPSTHHLSSTIAGLTKKLQRVYRVVKRIVQLLCTFAPVAALYPLHHYYQQYLRATTDDDTMEDPTKEDWYLKLCLRQVEWSGAVLIKLMQWASSRPDLFGEKFCAAFCNLQDSTTPHAWSHTCDAMEKAFGAEWADRIKIDKVIGSGCIGQVYKGEAMSKDGCLEPVAIKVIHPCVRDNIDADLDLLRFVAYATSNLPFTSSLKWLNLEGMTEEFANMLKIQLDFRQEALNLERFNDNFKGHDNVIFPQIVKGYDPHPDVLIETFCEGVPVKTFVRDNAHDVETLKKLCHVGVRSVCKMIFEDNFLHSDLHPGNIFVSPCGRNMVILDAGIVTEYTDKDHEMLVSILKSFIDVDGRRAGRLMIDDSNGRMNVDECGASDENGYIDKIEAMTHWAYGEDTGYLMEELGTYITYICESAATHRVMMNQAFITICLAVKVQEGVALMLDPSIEIWRIANPIIIRADLKRRVSKYWADTKEEIESWLK